MQQRLSQKNSQSQNYYFTRDINEILKNQRTQSTIMFKDLRFLDESEEYFYRFYDKTETLDKKKTLQEYYKFHNDIPRMFMIPETTPLNWYYDKKRRLEFFKIKRQIEAENNNNPDQPPKGIVGDTPIITQTTPQEISESSSYGTICRKSKILDGLSLSRISKILGDQSIHSHKIKMNDKKKPIQKNQLKQDKEEEKEQQIQQQQQEIKDQLQKQIQIRRQNKQQNQEKKPQAKNFVFGDIELQKPVSNQDQQHQKESAQPVVKKARSPNSDIMNDIETKQHLKKSSEQFIEIKPKPKISSNQGNNKINSLQNQWKKDNLELNIDMCNEKTTNKSPKIQTGTNTQKNSKSKIQFPKSMMRMSDLKNDQMMKHIFQFIKVQQRRQQQNPKIKSLKTSPRQDNRNPFPSSTKNSMHQIPLTGSISMSKQQINQLLSSATSTPRVPKLKQKLQMLELKVMNDLQIYSKQPKIQNLTQSPSNSVYKNFHDVDGKKKKSIPRAFPLTARETQQYQLSHIQPRMNTSQEQTKHQTKSTNPSSLINSSTQNSTQQQTLKQTKKVQQPQSQTQKNQKKKKLSYDNINQLLGKASGQLLKKKSIPHSQHFMNIYQNKND